MHPLAILCFVLFNPTVAIAAFVLAIASAASLKTAIAWMLALLAGGLVFGTTVAYPGYGSNLLNGGSTGAAYSAIGQLKKFNFAGLKAEFDDITNLQSPTIFKEWMKTVVDGDTVTFEGVMNPADVQTQGLLTNLATAGSAALDYWKISLTNGSVLVFQGYVQDFKFGAEYNKALTFNGTIKIVGNVTATW